MITLITGATHTGKTNLASVLMRKYSCPFYSIDHLKMGLIRSGNTKLTPMSDDALLTEYLWPIVREIIKTAIENRQDLIIEGCYIPLDWAEDFTEEYKREIKFICLAMSEEYIENHYDDILKFADIVERRWGEGRPSKEYLIRENKKVLDMCKARGISPFVINDVYEITI
ncbi:MAG: adenylate kinase [Eubacteriaceae bacterium]|jgi:2-phosphoglycerate kinase|nr:adenylate kinase [Eubacteriaceae bacterium]